jgi:hypothetical protein
MEALGVNDLLRLWDIDGYWWIRAHLIRLLA